MSTSDMGRPELSVVVPVFNEQDNVAPLIHEITAALRGNPLLAGAGFEIVYVDDDSRDATLANLQRAQATGALDAVTADREVWRRLAA